MQSILNIKQKMEEQAKMDFAAARMRLDEEEEKLQVLKDRKETYQEEGRALRRDSLKVREIIENRDAVAVMDEFIAYQQRQVALAEKELEQARQKLQIDKQENKNQIKLR